MCYDNCAHFHERHQRWRPPKRHKKQIAWILSKTICQHSHFISHWFLYSSKIYHTQVCFLYGLRRALQTTSLSRFHKMDAFCLSQANSMFVCFFFGRISENRYVVCGLENMSKFFVVTDIGCKMGDKHWLHWRFGVQKNGTWFSVSSMSFNVTCRSIACFLNNKHDFIECINRWHRFVPDSHFVTEKNNERKK